MTLEELPLLRGCIDKEGEILKKILFGNAALIILMNVASASATTSDEGLDFLLKLQDIDDSVTGASSVTIDFTDEQSPDVQAILPEGFLTLDDLVNPEPACIRRYIPMGVGARLRVAILAFSFNLFNTLGANHPTIAETGLA